MARVSSRPADDRKLSNFLDWNPSNNSVIREKIVDGQVWAQIRLNIWYQDYLLPYLDLNGEASGVNSIYIWSSWLLLSLYSLILNYFASLSAKQARAGGWSINIHVIQIWLELTL